MSNDARSVAEVVQYIHMLWSSLEQVTIAMVLLVQLLGWLPTFAGVIFIVGALPLQSFLVARVKSLRELASSHTDDRVKVVSETIKGIKLVKLYAWELSFVKRILQHRAKELDSLRKMAIVQACSSVVYTGVPTLLTLIVFTVYVLIGNTLDASVVFPAITLFNVLRPAMVILPYVLVSSARAAASLSRLQKFLMAEELVPLDESDHAVDQEMLARDGLDVAAEGAAFTWNPSETDALATLSNVSLSIPKGSLVAVVGSTGSGKSTLLAGLLGEVPIVTGYAGILKGRSVSFCDQIPFIQNASLRDNIIFGKPFDEHHYRETIRVCCLLKDLEILPAGDLTEIGGRGVNLSGGQRARVSLARAVYARTDINIFDDPLSAVDAHVGSYIFRECIAKQLDGTTRILTTNQIHFAASHDVNMVVVVKNGTIVEVGDRRNLCGDPDSEFARMLRAAGEGTDDSDEMRVNGDAETSPETEDGSLNDVNGSVSSEKDSKSTALTTKRVADYGTTEAGELTQKERKEKGRVQLKEYRSYLSAMGARWVVSVVLFGIAYQACIMAVNVWMSWWSEKSAAGSETNSIWFNLFVFCSFGVLGLFMSSGASFSIAFGGIRAAIVIHERLLLSVMGAPSSFFNSTPDGRLINRFTSDMDKLDQALAATLQTMNRLILSLIFTLGLIFWATPLVVFIAVPIITICVFVQEYYRRTAVDLRRLEALSRSPLYSHFSETLDGVVTLRAFGDIPRSTHMNNVYTDQLGRTMYASSYANRWLALRLEGLGTIFIFGATVLAVMAPPGQLSAATVGLVLSYTMQIIGTMTWCVRQFTDMESEMSSMERVSEYSQPPFPQEEKGGLELLLRELDSKKDGMKRAESQGLISSDRMEQLNNSMGSRQSRWPRKGKVEFEGVEMRYRADLSPALRNMSLTVQPGEHVGIVGRTGAGKSSAIQCLFRLYELGKGRIMVDGKDIKHMRLNALRSSLGVIPQEAVCFSGTIRTNLDTFGEHSDYDVQRALDGCGLQGTMRDAVSLSTTVEENGSNLSVGQRQLLCLGRALLKDSQVLVLDEATSNVSNEVDEKIQQTLREEMSHCTILTVAHRLHTVMKSDRIVVMDRGRIAEVGRPTELLGRESMLSALVDETGPGTAAVLRQLAVEGEGERQHVRKGGFNMREGHRMNGNGVSADGLGIRLGVEEASVSQVMQSVFQELRSALVKMERKEVQREMEVAVEGDECWRELLTNVVDKVSIVTGRVGETEQLDFERSDVHSGSNEAMAEILGTTPPTANGKVVGGAYDGDGNNSANMSEEE